MNEIERAIEYIDDLLSAIQKDGLAVRGILPWEYKAVKMAQDSLRAELSRQENAPTHKSVLLEWWAKDTREMAKHMIASSDESWTFMYHVAGKETMEETEDYEIAIRREIAYLNSAAEGASQ